MKKSKASNRKTPTRRKPYRVGSGSSLSRKKPGQGFNMGSPNGELGLKAKKAD